MQPAGIALIYTTCPTQEVADSIARTLVEERVAACVNMVPGIVSVYEWNGDIKRDTEIACIVKTTRPKADRAMERLKALHPYENPAIVVIEADAAAAKFEAWVAAQTHR
jgi:periplasmic divalent cation tolerance protein